MVVVIIVAIILYGKNLPSVARKAGRWYADIKRQITNVKDELMKQIPDEDLDITKDIKDISEDVKIRSFTDPDPDAADVNKPPAPSPSANLPGPDESDPEYKPEAAKAFDPSKPQAAEPAEPPVNGNGHADEPKPPAVDGEKPVEKAPG
jgi:sec-independent protein translocase protein TatA